MSFLTVFLLAVALSLDAFTVAVAAGCALRQVPARQYVRVGGTFGFFQFAMPVLGWMLGQSVHQYIAAWDHWIAFALLAWVGGNMLYGVWKDFRSAEGPGESACREGDPVSWRNLVILGVATSIDALAVGLTFAMTDTPVLWPSLVIGIVCFVLSAVGLRMGCLLAGLAVLQRWAGLLGGLVLLGIGLRILWQDGVFG